jgi:hypothetical protein
MATDLDNTVAPSTATDAPPSGGEITLSPEDANVQWVDPFDWIVVDWLAPDPLTSFMSEPASAPETVGVETEVLGEVVMTSVDDSIAYSNVIITDPLICFPPGFRPESMVTDAALGGLGFLPEEPIPVDPWPMPNIDIIYVDDMPTIVDDLVTGTSGNDRLTASPTGSGIYGGRGNDTLNGSQQRDLLWGEEDNDRIFGRGGSDRLYGSGGRDYLRGGDGDDILRGGAGRDNLYGGAGNDTLFGNEGRDRMAGGGGADVFVLQAGVGTETIVDFREGDRLGLFEIAYTDITLQQSGNNTRIKFDGKNLATLVGVNANTLTEADFGYVIYAL